MRGNVKVVKRKMKLRCSDVCRGKLLCMLSDPYGRGRRQLAKLQWRLATRAGPELHSTTLQREISRRSLDLPTLTGKHQ